MTDAPRVTFSLLTLTGLIFLFQLGSKIVFDQDVLILFGAKQNDLIRQGELWRFITPIFLHGSPFHLGSNLFILFILGVDLERGFGRLGFVLLFFLAGFAGYVFSFFLSSNVSIGASTAVFGLFGAQAIFLFRNRIMDLRARKFLAMGVFMLIATFLSMEMPVAIGIWSHVGGLVGGMIFAWFAGPVADQREPRGLIVGTAVVLLIFCTLAAIRMWYGTV